MTNGAAQTGRGAPNGAPRPTLAELRRSTRAAAESALDEFAKVERIVGAGQAYETFDGILAEHALALEEARDVLREGLRIACGPPSLDRALQIIDEQITYVQALGAVSERQEEHDAQ